MRKFAYGWVALWALLAGVSAQAGELIVLVNDGRGHPVTDAVITVVPRGSAATTGAPRPGAPVTRIIAQKDLAFLPYIEIFHVGDAVVFRNSDKTRHHVYSFSPIKQFEFVLAPGQSSAPQRLEKSGVVAAGCNIHDLMITYLYVSDAPWIARPDASGRAQVRDLPGGSYEVRVWHPRLRPGRPDLMQSTTVMGASGQQVLTFALSLLPDSRRQFDREHTQY